MGFSELFFDLKLYHIGGKKSSKPKVLTIWQKQPDF